MPPPSRNPEPRPENEYFQGGLVKPFLDHLEDLRWTLIKCLVAVAVSMGLCLVFVKQIIRLVELPLLWSGLTDDPSKFLRNLGVVDSFTIAFKIGLLGGLLLSLPVLLYFVAQFILPALTRRERGYLWPSFVGGAIMFLLGVAFCYFLLIPKTLQVSYEFGEYLGFQAEWTIQSYIGFVLQFALGMGLAFELPVIILLLVKIGVLSHSSLKRFRPHVIVVNFIVAAVVTPTTDILSMSMVAIPMIVLYEMCIWLARWMKPSRGKEIT